MTPFLYAYDTALLVRDKPIDTLKTTLQDNFNHPEDWFAANRLSLNIKKQK